MYTFIINFHDTEIQIIKKDLYSLFKSDTLNHNHKLNLKKKNQNIFYEVSTLNNEIVYLLEECINLNNKDLAILKQDTHYIKNKYIYEIYNDNFENETKTFIKNKVCNLYEIIKELCA